MAGHPRCPYCKHLLTRDVDRWICRTATYARCDVYSKRVTTTSDVVQPDLAGVYRACRSLNKAELKLREEIKRARLAGATLRDIAAGADMSYETVRRICEAL